MTKDQAVAFLSEAGHITEAKEIDENLTRIAFKYAGTRITLLACEDDADFLCLRCSYALDDVLLDELTVGRMVARLQENYKVVKVSANIEDPTVCASAELFLPPGRSFAPIFWRSVDLIVSVANDAYRELNTTVVAGSAAERFTEELEFDLHLRSEGSDRSALDK
jgi:hypothetical protein